MTPFLPLSASPSAHQTLVDLLDEHGPVAVLRVVSEWCQVAADTEETETRSFTAARYLESRSAVDAAAAEVASQLRRIGR